MKKVGIAVGLGLLALSSTVTAGSLFHEDSRSQQLNQMGKGIHFETNTYSVNKEQVELIEHKDSGNYDSSVFVGNK